MELTTSYLLKSVLVLLALYLFYYALLRRENNFSFNRIYLLIAPLLALGLPILKWPVAITPENAIGEALQAIQLTEVRVTGYSTNNANSVSGNFIPALAITFFYAMGVLLLLLELAKQLWQVKTIKAIAKPAATELHGFKVYQLPEHLPTFAFGSNIFLGNQHHLNKTDQEQVLAHELAHVKLRHTWDVLYYEVLSAILWVNPVVWLLKEELRDVHEYQADAKVVATYQAQAYSSLLSKEALLGMGLPIGSYFKKPQVLKRLKMLQQYGRKPNWLRPILVFPLIAGLTYIFSAQHADAQTGILDELKAEVSAANKTENKPEEPGATAITGLESFTEVKSSGNTVNVPLSEETVLDTKKEKTVASTPTNKTNDAVPDASTTDRPFAYVEEMPSFEGGETEMFKYLAKNIRYPKTAQDAGVTGLVVMGFIVERDGSLNDIQILKSLDESTDDEAKRVVQGMNGNWHPGKQNGIPVRVRYTLPIRFTLN